MSNLTKKNFAAGYFDLEVNNQQMTGHLKSVDGGMLKMASTNEPAGGSHLQQKHASAREVEPLSLEFGLSGASWALKAAEGVINRRQHERYSGAIVHTDPNFVEQYRYEFSEALMTEITFPKLDAKSKEVATLKAKLQPEIVSFKIGKGEKRRPGPVDKQKSWLSSAFLLEIEGLEEETKFATSVEPLTVKIGAKAYQMGHVKHPVYNPTKLEMPKLSFTVPLVHAKKLLEWFNVTCFKEEGEADGRYERTGGLEFLDPTHTKTVYSITFDGLGVENCQVVKADAHSSGTKLMKFDCYVTDMRLQVSGGKAFV